MVHLRVRRREQDGHGRRSQGGAIGKPRQSLGWGSMVLPQGRAAEWEDAHPRWCSVADSPGSLSDGVL